jgi:hypothetical protein
MSFLASNSIVLRQVLDRAQVATVGGLVGGTVASYLDVAGDPADPAEPDLFASRRAPTAPRCRPTAASSGAWSVSAASAR